MYLPNSVVPGWDRGTRKLDSFRPRRFDLGGGSFVIIVRDEESLSAPGWDKGNLAALGRDEENSSRLEGMKLVGSRLRSTMQLQVIRQCSGIQRTEEARHLKAGTEGVQRFHALT